MSVLIFNIEQIFISNKLFLHLFSNNSDSMNRLIDRI